KQIQEHLGAERAPICPGITEHGVRCSVSTPIGAWSLEADLKGVRQWQTLDGVLRASWVSFADRRAARAVPRPSAPRCPAGRAATRTRTRAKTSSSSRRA